MDKILSIITGPWGAFLGKGLMALTLAGMIYIGVAQYNENIRRNERMKLRDTQITQLLKENKEQNKRLDLIAKDNEQILVELKKKNDKVVETHNNVTKYIASPEAQKSNRESSDVLKNTIRMLKDEK